MFFLFCFYFCFVFCFCFVLFCFFFFFDSHPLLLFFSPRQNLWNLVNPDIVPYTPPHFINSSPRQDNPNRKVGAAFRFLDRDRKSGP